MPSEDEVHHATSNKKREQAKEWKQRVTVAWRKVRAFLDNPWEKAIVRKIKVLKR